MVRAKLAIVACPEAIDSAAGSQQHAEEAGGCHLRDWPHTSRVCTCASPSVVESFTACGAGRPHRSCAHVVKAGRQAKG